MSACPRLRWIGQFADMHMEDVKYKYFSTVDMTGPVAARSEALIAWTLRSWVRIPVKTWMFVLVFLCCVVLCR
jgi:hypothetical protein